MQSGLASITDWLMGPEPLDHGPGSRDLSAEESQLPSALSASGGPLHRLRSLWGPRSSHLWPRWLFLRTLGLIYFSAFYSLLFQVKGLIGPDGILPARDYLEAVLKYYGAYRFWFAPTLLWFSSSNHSLMLICWVGLAAAILLTLNLWPRGMLVVCFVAYLSFVGAGQDFAGYQSDGMLLSAGFISMFFAPPGFRPRLGRANAPTRASLFLLQLVWFTIYFESGLAKMLSGEPAWRNFTAMDNYYQNGPLPTWLGWYAQQLPHWFHAGTVGLTLAVELVIVWMLFLPRRLRIICFWMVTPFEIGIIVTANYTFLNYLVLSLGILLLDDRFADWFWRLCRRRSLAGTGNTAATGAEPSPAPAAAAVPAINLAARGPQEPRSLPRTLWLQVRASVGGLCLALVFYSIVAQLLAMILPWLPLPTAPVRALDPFRIANRYGLFAVMTPQRYEIEFQGTEDGTTWTPYPFRYKPQDLATAPGIYAPYQPRFDWNLWFASLGPWREYPFVVYTEERLLKNDAEVLHLFAANPFAGAPPKRIRAVIWQYWFTDIPTKRTTGMWWRRQLLGLYAPGLQREADGKITAVDSSEIAPAPDQR
ncbi:MAG: lipase maturation factor family protein [Candidatus Acidiferrales bacterium]|jgi:lipase maturation factor 1